MSKSLGDELSERVYERVYQDIGQASMCWETPEGAGVFCSEDAAQIARDLCIFIAEIADEYHDRA